MSNDLHLLSLDWSLPDQLVCMTVSALLHLAVLYPRYRSDATSSILHFSSKIIERLKMEHRECLYTNFDDTY